MDTLEDGEGAGPVARSTLRARNVQLLDELDTRYAGEKVSRKKFGKLSTLHGSHLIGDQTPLAFIKDEEVTNESEDESDSDGDSVDGEEFLSSQGTERRSDAEGNSSEEESENEEEGDSEDASDPDSEDDSNSAGSEKNDTEGMRTLSLHDKEAEIEKGRATLNQLRKSGHNPIGIFCFSFF